eukprot:2241008-Rhodomonas_salina.2
MTRRRRRRRRACCYLAGRDGGGGRLVRNEELGGRTEEVEVRGEVGGSLRDRRERKGRRLGEGRCDLVLGVEGREGRGGGERTALLRARPREGRGRGRGRRLGEELLAEGPKLCEEALADLFDAVLEVAGADDAHVLQARAEAREQRR